MQPFRIILITLLLFIYNNKIAAQDEGAFQFEPMTEGNYYWNSSDFSVTTGFGLNLWLVDHVAFNIEFQIGYDNQYGFTFNTGWGQVLGGWLGNEFGGNGSALDGVIGVTAILAFLSPEGVTFAINPYDDLVFMPYVIPLEAHYMGVDKRFRCSGEIGLKFHWRLDNGMAIRPKIGLRYLYGLKRAGIEVGIGMVLYDSVNM